MNKNIKHVTYQDIANELGVSKMAVSKAFSNSPDISNALKEKIKAKANELGYIKDDRAASLKSGKTNSVAIIFHGLENPYFSNACFKVTKELKKLGYNSSLYFTDKFFFDYEDLQDLITIRHCAIISFVEPTKDVANFFKEKQIPFILVGIKSTLKNIDLIYTDDYDGGKQVAEFYNKGEFTKSIFINDTYSETGQRRHKGFVENLKNPAELSYFLNLSKNFSIYDESIRIIMKEKIKFIVCVSDVTALKIRAALKSNSYKEDYIIIGYDNLNKYSPIVKEINTIDYDLDEIVKFASCLLHDKLTNKIPIDKHIEKVFPVKLIIKN